MNIRELMDIAPVREYKLDTLAGITVSPVSSDALVGIEVEVERTNVVDIVPEYWHTKSDGSLRNGGTEFVSSPIKARYVPYALEQLLGRSLSKDCSFTMRTSVHIHLDVQTLTKDQVLALTMLYSLFEPAFYKFCGRGRHKNIYCVPINDTTTPVSLTQNPLGKWDKYTGYNMRTLTNYGTVEFRHMPGTYDLNKLVSWVDIVTKFRDYVTTRPIKEILKSILDTNSRTDYQAMLRDIVGDAHTEFFSKTSNAELHQASLRMRRMVVSKKLHTDLAFQATSTSEYLTDLSTKGL